MNISERGEGLVEVVIAVAIAAMTIAALLSGVIAATHRFGPNPVRSALMHQAQSDLRLATNAMKYQGATLSATSISTNVPVPGGSPLAATETLSTSTNADGSIAVSITASTGSGESVTANTTIPKPAPAPSANIAAQVNGSNPI